MYIITRDSIPSINSITVDNVVHNLGILKDFRKHDLLRKYLPEAGRLSISWVRLKKDEMLDIHQHPTTSMIIITCGQVEVCGDLKTLIKEGDIVLIPAGSLHGFIGRGEEGFWGLSLQFEGNGLYENIEEPRVNFTTL